MRATGCAVGALLGVVTGAGKGGKEVKKEKEVGVLLVKGN